MVWPLSPHARRCGHRCLALCLVLLALVAQQLGALAHGAMQLRHALAGSATDFCTTLAVVDRALQLDAPVEPASSRRADPDCAACTLAAAVALPPAFAGAQPLVAAAAASPTWSPQRVAVADPRSAHRSRAPPAVIA